MIIREYTPGIGQAVADRTINRMKADGTREVWGDVAHRVALGNCAVTQAGETEFTNLKKHLSQASLLMSGRHLQHGDETQPLRSQEVFTNCSTSAASFLLLRLLLSGSGVGTDYSDHMQLIDWAKDMPNVVCTIDPSHPDVLSGEIKALSRRDAEHLYRFTPFVVHEVEDSREGWAEAVQKLEEFAFKRLHGMVLILDFSKVRHRGQPIRGMQNRPTSGPGPLMEAFRKIAAVKNSGMPAWMATMFVDHFLAECVLVGGARRAARMATKYWKDKGVLDFIQLKRGGFLWSSNNSILVDAEFWEAVQKVQAVENTAKVTDFTELEMWAYRVYNAAIEAAYHDGTGEPGFINVDKLEFDSTGIEAYIDGSFVDIPEMADYLAAKARACLSGPYHVITNPCGEIVLFLLGGYCVIADVVPFFAANDDDAEDAFRVAVRALIRTNQMHSLYIRETKRTNRIGVGFTGLFEFALKRFGYGWHDLVDEAKSLDFWLLMKRFSDAVKDEAVLYAHELGVTVPHTATTVKPAGTTSKLFNLSEGAHLPAMLWYLRWVQFRNDDPLIEEYRAKGYPVRQLKTYTGTTVVGFPTKPAIVELAEELGLVDKLVTAAQATPEEQFQWLRLLEKYWIGEEKGNQVSYTLKYDPKKVSFDEFKATILANQSSVKCCSVMPQIDGTAYEYQPEEPVTKGYFEFLVSNIEAAATEDIDLESLKCASGACPI